MPKSGTLIECGDDGNGLGAEGDLRAAGGESHRKIIGLRQSAAQRRMSTIWPFVKLILPFDDNCGRHKIPRDVSGYLLDSMTRISRFSKPLTISPSGIPLSAAFSTR